MNSGYPKVRYYVADGFLLFREGMSINIYIQCAHDEISPRVLDSLDIYLNAVGPSAIGRYVDDDGQTQKLDAEGWKRIREDCLNPTRALIRLRDVLSLQYRYGFEYHGCGGNGAAHGRGLPEGSAVSFWLPTEYLEEHGPGRVRALAVELASSLPYCSGQAGLSFNGETSPLGRSEEARALCFRHPGIDCASVGSLSWPTGPQIRGPSWLTFLGPPLLGEMGGAAALRSRLVSPGTHVQEMDEERAVITLGEAPEAGDLEQGQTLPAYRELARVLEPWLYHDEIAARWNPDQLRWERRFLD